MFLDIPDSTKAQGDIGEARAIYEFTKLGFCVSKPLSAHSPYDLIIDDGSKLQRVQVKTSSSVKGQGYEVCLAATAVKQTDGVQSWTKIERSSEYDLLFVLTIDGNVWIIPENMITGKYTITLTENGKYGLCRLIGD